MRADRHDEANSHFSQFCDRVCRTCKGRRYTDGDMSLVYAKYDPEALLDDEVLCLEVETILLLDHSSSIIIINSVIP